MSKTENKDNAKSQVEEVVKIIKKKKYEIR